MNETARMLSVVLVILMTASSAVDIGSVEATPTRILLEIEKSFVNVLGQSPDVLAFAGFSLQYKRMYRSPEEIKQRYSVFKENLDLIRSTNNKGLSYKLGVNQFADLTYQEFAAQYLFTLPKHCQGPPKESPEINIFEGINSNETREWPPEINWRDYGMVTLVKNQGKCGSSWVFSAIGALEAAVNQRDRKNITFSEQQILDCSYQYRDCMSSCHGGLPSGAFTYLESHFLATDDEYAYVARRRSCRSPLNQSPHLDVTHIFTTSLEKQRDPEDSLKEALLTAGPVSILLEVVNSLRFYKSGVYTTSDCGNPTEVNHAGLVVGYAKENGLPYWFIKNSWGAEWGDEGYFKIEMGKNMCGVASMGVYPVIS